MTTPTPADAVRESVHGLSTLEVSPEEIAADAIRVAADALLPRPAIGDRSPKADASRLLRLQFLELANELAGNPAPAASREALAEAREESQAAAWQGIEPEQVLPAVEALARSVAADIPPGPYSEYDLRQQWNAQAADGEDWDDLESYEQLAWAQTQAIAADRGRTAQVAEPTPTSPPGPIAWCRSSEFDDAALKRQSFNGWRQYHPDCDVALYAVPVPTLAEALAARPLLEQVAAMADCVGAHTVGQITAISARAAAWLRENPPGQPVALEPRGCPTPGACSCVEPAATAPALPPALAFDGGNEVKIEATNRDRTSWAARISGCCLNRHLDWEPEPMPSGRDHDFLDRARWPSAEEAYAALLEYRASASEEVQS